MAGLALVAASVAASGCAWLTPGDPLDPGRRADSGVARPVLGLAWKRVLDDQGGSTRAQEFATALFDPTGRGTIYIGSGKGTLWALDPKDGLPRWHAAVGAVSSRPILLDGKLYLGTDDGQLLAINAADGSIAWRYSTRGSVLHPAVVAGDLIVFSNEADHVYALDRKTGTWKWQYDRETPEEFTVRGHGGVIVDGTRVYAGFADGNLAALDLTTGDVVWTHSLAASETQFVDVDATPVIDRGVIYASSVSGGVWALDAADGNERWRAPIQGATDVVLDGGRLYVAAADQGLYALDRSGHVLWRQGLYRAGDPARPVVDGDYLFLSAANAGMFVVDKRSGGLVQSFNPGFGVSAPPTIVGDRLYVLSNAGVLYAMSVSRY